MATRKYEVTIPERTKNIRHVTTCGELQCTESGTHHILMLNMDGHALSYFVPLCKAHAQEAIAESTKFIGEQDDIEAIRPDRIEGKEQEEGPA